MAHDSKQPGLRDPLEDMLGYQLRRAAAATFSALVESLEVLGIRPTEAVIVRFVEANPGCNQAEISRALGVQRTNMVPIINGLVEAGLINRTMADGRTHALFLTDKGLDLNSQIERLAHERESRLFGDFDETTKAILMCALRSIREKVKND